MIFTTQIRRGSDPSVLHPVVVALDGLKYVADEFSIGPEEKFELRISVYTDRDQNGTPDVNSQIPGGYELEKLFYATSAQLRALGNIFRGSGNLMVAIRNFSKNQVDAWNAERWFEYNGSSSGEITATHTDIDDDEPV